MRPIDADAMDVEKIYCYYSDHCRSEDVQEWVDEQPTLDLEPVRWIPVTERLPEKHGGVYACLLKFPESKEPFPFFLTWHAYGDNGYVSGPHFSDEGLDGLKVTHWIPLPEPPKKEEE